MDAKPLLESLHAPGLPLHVDKYGAIRVGGARVTLDAVRINFQRDSRPECIVQHLPALKLEDVYTLIAYYLRNRAAFDAYLEELERIAQENRKKWEALYPSNGLREKLLKRYQELLPACLP